MTLLTLRGIKKSFGDTNVLVKVDADLANRERVGLVGMNGAGKTTLANMIFGSIQPDEGKLTFHKDQLRIGYLLQSTSYTVSTFSEMMDPAAESRETEQFLQTASHLGLQKVKEWDGERLAGLSGGEKTKLAIAHIWASKPDILLLDEPTNHLDFDGVDWLVQELRRYSGTTIVISHDRYFLDQTVDRIIELQDGVSTSFPGNYTFYREEKARRFQSQLHQFEEQQKYEQKIEAEITRLKNWSDKAHREAGKVGKMAEMRTGVKEFYRSKAKAMDKQIKSRLHRLEKIDLEGVKKPVEEAKVSFGWDQPEKRGRRLVEAQRIGKSYGGRSLFADSSFYLQRGERVGLLGPNGSGKTTLIQMLLGQKAVDTGQLWISPTAKVAYLTQDVTDLDQRRTVLELLQDSHEIRSDVGKARTMLANMGFDASMLQKPIAQLSLGERTRIKLSQLMMREQDLLILDEPTNHLDLTSREQLEATLSDYRGTLIVVSHDRYLIDKICTKLLVFQDGGIRRIESGYESFREKPQASQAAESENQDAKQQLEEEKMVIANRIAFLLGEFSLLKPTDSRYTELDAEYKLLLAQRKQLNTR
ncbi:ribosomal protection-like ABC-F family protein [Paenibacillus sp. CF384]|uniref:ribosomal protection-like ABC-F family protein n=1 Tax=Paenibacillus sp. CF384 TaxID=1884382 RepID=UPI0008946B03|nr:ABC-F type ribosomal protection protein [Paenibacillus sp. CF384]SDW13486.1 macrolide transport system ATP-binding/permease protein [Paenibacillus sp. CF384]